MPKAIATLPLNPAMGLAAFRQFAQKENRTFTQEEDTLTICLMNGSLVISPEADQTRLTISGTNPAALQLIRDTLMERLAGLGVSPKWHDSQAGRQPGNQSLATIVKTERISPSYTRVTIEGPDLARFAIGGLHFRLLFGPKGADWPKTDASGATDWPGGASAWHRPVYTTRLIEGNRIDFDVFRHEGGRVTDWCDKAAPGDEIAITGPGGSSMPEPTPWMGLVGDETAVPVMARILEALPENTAGNAVLFIPDPADQQDIPHPPGVSLRWVLRSAPETPIEALKSLHIPDGKTFTFFAAETSEAKEARMWLATQGFAKSAYRAAGYWTQPAKGTVASIV